jgi:hypothetical protein
MKHLYRTLRALAVTGCLVQSVWVGAQTATVFQQSLSDSLGAFSSTGSVALGAAGATLKGSLLGKDGALTSSPISTVGYTNITQATAASPCGSGFSASQAEAPSPSTTCP